MASAATLFLLSFPSLSKAVLLSACITAALAGMARADQASAVVGVEIHVPPIAEVQFPQGADFSLEIPSREEGLGPGGPFRSSQPPQLDAARIPFLLLANHTVTITAVPVRVFGTRGDVLIGAATQDGGDAVLPYTLQLEIEGAGTSPHLRGFGITRGLAARHQNEVTVRSGGQPLSGVVHVHPDVSWGEIASRRFAGSGVFTGEIRISVISDAE
jgi:hypothetical protein